MTDILSPSQEDYLEAILDLSSSHQVARGRDIAQRMGVTPASVTGALRSLAEKGLVEHQPYTFATLTPEGRRQAERVTRRHEILRIFLADALGLDQSTADATACRLEHAVEDSLLERLERLHAGLAGLPSDQRSALARIVAGLP